MKTLIKINRNLSRILALLIFLFPIIYSLILIIYSLPQPELINRIPQEASSSEAFVFGSFVLFPLVFIIIVVLALPIFVSDAPKDAKSAAKIGMGLTFLLHLVRFALGPGFSF